MKSHIAFASDVNYIKYVSVLMLSILNNTQHSNQIEFHYAINNISQKDKSILKQLAKKYKSKINFYGFEDERLKNYPLLFNNPNAYPTYYRIYFGEMLPKNIKKVLYLDTDTMLRADIQEIYQTDLKDNFIAGAIDNMNIEHKKKYPNLPFYINTGVAIINLEQFRKTDIKTLSDKYVKQNFDNIIYADQDILNNILVGKIHLLPPEYNVQLTRHYKKVETPEIEVFENIKSPKIIHFLGPKPWSTNCKNRYKKEWDYYASLSPYFSSNKKTQTTSKLFSKFVTEEKVKYTIFGIKFTFSR